MNARQEVEGNGEERVELALPPPPEQSPQRVPSRWWVLAPLIALLGGLFGIIGAFYTELLRGSLLFAFVGASIIAQSLNPS